MYGDFGIPATAPPTPAFTFDINDGDVDTLEDKQEIVLYVCTMVSASISIIGSMTIAWKVIRNMCWGAGGTTANSTIRRGLAERIIAAWLVRQETASARPKRKANAAATPTPVSRPGASRRAKVGPYDRLLLGLSMCDIISSLTYALTPFLLPRDTSDRAWASGTEATCTALGFLTQFSYSALVYNGLLSLYYLLTVRYAVKRRDFEAYYERYMHFGVVSFFCITAALGAMIGLYNEIDLGPGCWIRDYPRGCYENDNVDCIGHYFGWIFTGLPGLATLMLVIINNLVIYFHVRRVLSARPTAAGTNDPTSSGRPRNLTTIRDDIRYKAHIKEVASQGILYVMSFLLCFSCHFVLRVLESSGFQADTREGEVFWLLVLDSILRPLQGFINCLVYTRPNYIRLRNAFPDQPMLWLMMKACREVDIPKLQTSSLTTTNHRSGQSNGSNNAKRYFRGIGADKGASSDNVKQQSSGNSSSYKSSKNSASKFSSNLSVVSEASNESNISSAALHVNDNNRHNKDEDRIDGNDDLVKLEEQGVGATMTSSSSSSIPPLESNADDDGDIIVNSQCEDIGSTARMQMKPLSSISEDYQHKRNSTADDTDNVIVEMSAQNVVDSSPLDDDISSANSSGRSLRIMMDGSVN